MPGVIEKIVLVSKITANALPVVGMILIVPFIESDYILTIIYGAIIVGAFAIYQDRKDRVFAAFGLVAAFIAEALFISTGVETFERTTLFGLMPLWLPFLWAYIFIAIRRAAAALEEYLH